MMRIVLDVQAMKGTPWSSFRIIVLFLVSVLGSGNATSSSIRRHNFAPQPCAGKCVRQTDKCNVDLTKFKSPDLLGAGHIEEAQLPVGAKPIANDDFEPDIRSPSHRWGTGRCLSANHL
jgi:hypothetical protein